MLACDGYAGTNTHVCVVFVMSHPRGWEEWVSVTRETALQKSATPSSMLK